MSNRFPAFPAIALALLATSPAALGQGPRGTTFAIVPIYQSDSDLDSGGEAGYSALLATLGFSWSLGARSSLGVALKYDYEDWRFSDLAAFGGDQPWDDVYRYSISLPYRYTADGGWVFGFSPTVEYSGESGAGISDSLEYGAMVSAARRMSPHLTIGAGVGVYERIDQVRAFPFLVVDWRIGDRWRLTNPLSAGPAGPAGLELSYTLGPGWETGLAVAYRSFRFRLDGGDPAPDGIGENSYVPVVARLGRKFSEELAVNLYAGLSLDGRLRLENSDGHCIYCEDRDPSAIVGIALTGRF